MTPRILPGQFVMDFRTPDTRSVARRYRDAELRMPLGACPIEAGFLGSLVDNECAHGALPGDRVQSCGCWR
jgi:hypothetical protein